MSSQITSRCFRSSTRHSQRLQRDWNASFYDCAQQYDFQLEYSPGASNPADYLSRYPPGASSSTADDDVEAHVNFVIDNAVPKTCTREEIEEASKADPVIQLCIKAIRENLWHKIAQDVTPAMKIEIQCLARIKQE